MVRPTDVLTCYFTRRRLDALVDGALADGERRSTAAHVASCDRCRREVDELQRLRLVIRRTLAVPGPSDWSGFWAGVARGIEDRPSLAPIARPGFDIARLFIGPRLAFGAAAALLLVSFTVWEFWGPEPPVESPVLVRSAVTEMPGASLMVYSPPERDTAVVWLLAADDSE